jgi:hypothetical protein
MTRLLPIGKAAFFEAGRFEMSQTQVMEDEIMTTKPFIQAVERSIDKTVRDFQRLGFNFITENDLYTL